MAVASAEVVKLTPDNFDSIVKDPSKTVFVKFFAPWCGHCQRMAPTWEDLSTQVGSDVVVAELDCDAHRDLGQTYGIRGFPTIKLFKKGEDKEPVAYQGARDIKAFKTFLENNA